jgi:hypothetical protein
MIVFFLAGVHDPSQNEEHILLLQQPEDSSVVLTRTERKQREKCILSFGSSPASHVDHRSCFS